MVNDLSHRDRRQLQTLWRDFGEQPEAFDRSALRRRVVELVPCDYSSFNWIDEWHGRAVSEYLPAEAISHADYHAFESHVHQHPMLHQVRATGDGTPRRLSDVMSHRAWHDLGLYHEFFRSMKVEYQAAFAAGDARAPAAAAVTFNRSTRDFDDRDMAVLACVRPMFQLLHALAAERQRATAIELLLRGDRSHGFLIVGPLGHIEWQDDAGSSALRSCFGAAIPVGAVLPPVMLEWLCGSAPSLRVRGSGEELVVMQRGARVGDHRTVALGIARQVDHPELTEREQGVLRLVGEGLANRDVAARLCISVRTVEKHLENAYVKLGVRNRVAAARRVVEDVPARSGGLFDDGRPPGAGPQT